jgi:hypothetical protein
LTKLGLVYLFEVYLVKTDPLPYYKWQWKDYRASRTVQKMDYIEKGLYRELLDEVWAKGYIPDNIDKLSDICGCPTNVMLKAWARLAPCFYEVSPGCLVNEKLETLRTEVDSQRASAARSGFLGALAKQDSISGERHIEEQEQSREEKNLFAAEPLAKLAKTVHIAKSADERHVPFRNKIEEYWLFNNKNELPWNGSEAKKLSLFLEANPKIQLEEFAQLLRNRQKSEENHSERPRVWIESLNRYGSGPLDRFGKPKNGTKLTDNRTVLLDSRAEIREEIRHANPVSGRVLYHLESGTVKGSSKALLEVPRKVHD